MSIIKHVTLQKIVAHDFRYVPHILFSVLVLYRKDILVPALNLTTPRWSTTPYVVDTCQFNRHRLSILDRNVISDHV